MRDRDFSVYKLAYGLAVWPHPFFVHKGIRPKEASLPLRQLSQASSTTNTAIIISSSPLCLSLRVCNLLPVLVQTYFFCNLQKHRFHYSHQDSFKLQIRKLSHLLFQLTCNPFPFT